MAEPVPAPQFLTPCNSRTRRTTADPNSPEFEFWIAGNPNFSQPNLLSADELFSDGVLLPLHLLHLSDGPLPPQHPEPSGSDPALKPEPSTTELAELSATSSLTSSKRWGDIFRRNDKKTRPDDHSTKGKDSSTVKEKKRKKNNGAVGGAGSGVTAAELNINIWPFSRSRSAGNGGTRPRSAAATRKVSSAPCSRSNSAGESKSRKWPSSPGRAGVHLGRSSPVWQVRRRSEAVVKSADKGVKKDENEARRKLPAFSEGGGGARGRVLSLNVPMCIGYRHQLSCRSDDDSAGGVAAPPDDGGGQSGAGVAGEGVRGSNLFNIRSLFTKKVY